MVNHKKQSKLTKTAAREERTERKKQMDLRQALSKAPRNRTISDSEARSTSSQKRHANSVSPEKESRRTSKRLQRIQRKHAGEIKVIERTQKQLTDEFDDLKKSQVIEVDREDAKHDSDDGSIQDLKNTSGQTNDDEDKSIVRIDDDSDKDMARSYDDDEDDENERESESVEDEEDGET